MFNPQELQKRPTRPQWTINKLATRAQLCVTILTFSYMADGRCQHNKSTIVFKIKLFDRSYYPCDFVVRCQFIAWHCVLCTMILGNWYWYTAHFTKSVECRYFCDVNYFFQNKCQDTYFCHWRTWNMHMHIENGYPLFRFLSYYLYFEVIYLYAAEYMHVRYIHISSPEDSHMLAKYQYLVL